jgi:heme-degrading monooxygenase HmoA
MIIEVTTIIIKENKNLEFESAFENVGQVLAKAEGYISHELQKCIENTNQYLVLIKWNNLEDHTVKFQPSGLFKELGSLISSFFERKPNVLHYELTQNPNLAILKTY